MHIYAIRDRLLNYYQQPIAAHTDKEVLGSLSTLINQEDSNAPIAQAPHHFEIWRLGTVNEETGHIDGRPEFLADLNTLLRTTTRPRRESTEPRDKPLEGIADLRRTTAGKPFREAGAYQRIAQGATQAADSQGETTHRPTD